jgi:hypothetical protein
MGCEIGLIFMSLSNADYCLESNCGSTDFHRSV